MSSPQAPNSPARSEALDLYVDERDAFPSLPGVPVDDGLGERDVNDVDDSRNWTPATPPSRSEHSNSYSDVRDAFADVPELPAFNPFDPYVTTCHHEQNDAIGDLSGSVFNDSFTQQHDAGHHQQANDQDDHTLVHDVFATLPVITTNNLDLDIGTIGFDYNPLEHNELTGSQDNTNFEQSLQHVLTLTRNHTGVFAPTSQGHTAQARNKKLPVADNNVPDGEFNPKELRAHFLSGVLSPSQQAGAVDALVEQNMDAVYQDLMRSHGFQRIQYPAPTAAAPMIPCGTLTENNYAPIAWEPEAVADVDPDVDPNIPPTPPPQPIYPAFTGRFTTGPAARAYRKRNRVPRKDQAPDIERVKRFGRMYWVRRIYESMIDISNVSDSPSSIHRTRFTKERAFDALDMEAAAHHVFDEAVAVHERGWVRPTVYHKKVVRGKLTDVSEKCLERRLARICLCLQQKKATCDDAMRGGVTLALLCDNPEARGFTKLSNNAGNAKRGDRLRAAKEAVEEMDEDEERDRS